MQIRSVRFVSLVVAILLAVGICFVEAGAQKRKRTRRAYPPASPTPSPDDSADPNDPRIVSTSDQMVNSGAPRSPRPKSSPTPTPESEQDALRRTISDLTGQVTKLSEKLNELQDQQRSLVDIERLSRAEQRAESFRAQLRDVQEKETDLQMQIDQIEYAIQPENIERVVGMFGTTHPEEAREQRRKQLESQRAKLKAQYAQLEQSRVRLEAAIVTADAEVEALQKRLGPINPTSQTPTDQPTPAPIYTPPNSREVPPQ